MTATKQLTPARILRDARSVASGELPADQCAELIDQSVFVRDCVLKIVHDNDAAVSFADLALALQGISKYGECFRLLAQWQATPQPRDDFALFSRDPECNFCNLMIKAVSQNLPFEVFSQMINGISYDSASGKKN